MLELEGDIYLTSEEACEMLGVKASTLYAYVSRNILGSYRQGIRRTRLYRLAEVEGLLRVKPASDDLVEIPLVDSWMGDK
ncbi:MAG TPA: helix-turn-helix domain-containing protein [Chloroflexota bacterium]|nr:helix-turn-helix domain-containing protein [Chloroflexota bacterium]